jgi:hypothetical protein
MMLIGITLLLARSSPGWTTDGENVERYRMQSVLEYSGKGQFSNTAGGLFTVRKKLLSDGRASYNLSANDLGPIEGERNHSELTFFIDGKTGRLSAADKNLAMLEKVTNHCVGALTKVTRDSVGKTWKQTFDLSSVGKSFPGKLSFTLTAIPLDTKVHGELVAVRALSEPFFVQSAAGPVQCRMNCAYVFGASFEDVFLSASVFAATTNVNGYGEKLKHTVTTWKVDAAGQPANFSDLKDNKEFEKFTSKLGLTRSLRVAKAAPLPQWARSEGVRAAQVANACAAISCEGALNPVATIYIPVASTVGLQSVSQSMTASALLGAAGEAEGVEGYEDEGGLKWWPPWANIGWNWPTAAWGTGLGVGIAAAAGAFDSDDDDDDVRSPPTP